MSYNLPYHETILIVMNNLHFQKYIIVMLFININNNTVHIKLHQKCIATLFTLRMYSIGNVLCYTYIQFYEL